MAADLIDLETERLHYFHGPGMFALSGADFRGVFRIGEESPGARCPRIPSWFALTPAARWKETSCALPPPTSCAVTLPAARRVNPFRAFGAQLDAVLPQLLDGDLATYHAYAFATVRMAGSAFEILGDHVRWLLGADGDEVAIAATEIVDGCKALSFRLARRRRFETEARVAELASAWERLIGGLGVRVGALG